MDHQFYYYTLLAIFAVVAYMMVLDPNVGKYVILLTKMARVKVSRAIFWLKFYPRLRYDTAVLKWKSQRILKKQLREADK